MLTLKFNASILAILIYLLGVAIATFLMIFFFLYLSANYPKSSGKFIKLRYSFVDG